ncbi:hypothetical protein FCV25MIE_07718 [Fagus crenata]
MGLNFPYTVARYNSAWSSRGGLSGPHIRLEGNEAMVVDDKTCETTIPTYPHGLPCQLNVCKPDCNTKPKLMEIAIRNQIAPVLTLANPFPYYQGVSANCTEAMVIDEKTCDKDPERSTWVGLPTTVQTGLQGNVRIPS